MGSSASAPGTSGASAWRFLVDENLPYFLADHLRAAGHYAEHVYDAGLRGVKDPPVYAYAQAQRLTIVTGDKGFGDIRVYPPPHAGLVVVEVPDKLPVADRARIIVDGLAQLAEQLSGQSLANALVILERGRVRV